MDTYHLRIYNINADDEVNLYAYNRIDLVLTASMYAEVGFDTEVGDRVFSELEEGAEFAEEEGYMTFTLVKSTELT